MNRQPIFIGRKHELERLMALHHKKRPGLVVVKGRRRVGKSRLIAEFASKAPKSTFWSFAGLAPQEGISAQGQRDHFARQLALMLTIPPLTFSDWSDAFEHLSLHLKAGDIVLFDEISWMGAKDPTFIPKLKVWWDKQTTAFLLVFCGSVSTWIEDNILKSTAFFGRVNLEITLEPLSIPESAELLQKLGNKCSPYDMYKLLAILGGIPWYLEQLNSQETADENIRQLAFEKNGLLVLEFDRIFHDLFDGKGTTYKKILEALKDGSRTLVEVRKTIDFAHSGTLSTMMEHLITAGFVQKQPQWSFKTTKPLKKSLYRISDPYIRFYLKMVEPHLAKIVSDGFRGVSLSSLPGFEAHLGLQVEYLLLQNRPLLLKAIGISATDVVCDGPYRQSATTTHRGCQIDYLVQTATNNLFICEFKFKRRELSTDVINDVQDKTEALVFPKGFAAVPVLFHLSGVSDSLETASYFYRVVDITHFLE
ncbi:MAG: ATP-binding protein [Verrucomicrobia bacterium]|nr:ATP-binding protein [Verrucomicrobiota bacterium]